MGNSKSQTNRTEALPRMQTSINTDRVNWQPVKHRPVSVFNLPQRALMNNPYSSNPNIRNVGNIRPRTYDGRAHSHSKNIPQKIDAPLYYEDTTKYSIQSEVATKPRLINQDNEIRRASTGQRGVVSPLMVTDIHAQSSKPAIMTAPTKFLTIDDFIVRWPSWKEEFLIYIKSINIGSDKKGLMLLNHMGPIGQQIQRTFTFDNDCTREDMDMLLKKFDLYFIFGDRKKEDNEDTDKYVNNLKIMALKHNGMSNTDDVLKDKIFMEIDKNRFTNRVTSLIPTFSFISDVKSLTVKEITYIWMSYENPNFKKEQEISNRQIKNCNNCGRTHAINRCYAEGKKCTKCDNTGHFSQKCPSRMYFDNCSKCGEDHFIKECPAYENECTKCHQWNHFSWKCDKERKKILCKYCGLVHIPSKLECSATYIRCYICSKKGHIPSKCYRNKNTAFF